MIVDFFIAGAQKSGTTTLYRFLAMNRRSDVQGQEPHFFDDDTRHWNRIRILRWRELRHYHRQFSPGRATVVRGEVTPIYMFWRNAIERIRALQSRPE